jgi:RHS repeat-associated protein
MRFMKKRIREIFVLRLLPRRSTSDAISGCSHASRGSRRLGALQTRLAVAALFLAPILGRPVPVHSAAAWCNDLIGVATYGLGGSSGCPPGQKHPTRYIITTTCSGANVPSVGHCSMFTGPQWVAVAGESVDAPLGGCESSPHGPIIGISCDPEDLPKQCPVGNATGAPSAYVGDPVDLTSGALKLTPTDVDLGGGLVWTRHYVSTSTTTGPMGRGWLAGLGWSLVRSNVPMPPGAPMATIPGFLIQRPLRPPVFVIWDYDTLQYRTGVRQSGLLTVDPDTTVHFVDEDGTTVTFDPLDRLVSLELPGELPIAVTYGTDTATYSNGQQSLTVTNYASGHANAGRVSTVTANGDTWSYGYDASQNLTTVTGPDPSTPSSSDTVTWTYVYTTPASSGRVSRLDRTVGGVTTTIGSWTYVGSNPARVATVDEGALEQALNLSYQVPEANRLKATLKNSTNQTLAVFDSTNNILYDVTNTTGPAAPVAGGAGISIDFTHATIPLVPGTSTVTQQYGTQVDANGNVTLFEGRDGRGRPARVVEGWIDGLTAPGVFSPDDTYARLREYTYHPVLDETLSITEESPLTGNFDKVTIFDYDDLADPTDDPGIPNEKPTKHLFTRIERGHTLDATGAVVAVEAMTRFTYDGDGRILTEAGPRPENFTEYEYDPTTGYRTAVRRYLNGSGSTYLETTFADFDARGNPETISDANGRPTLFTYDTEGRVKTMQPPYTAGDSTITSTYDVDGNLVRVDFPDDSFSDPYFVRMGYDAKNRMTFLADAQGNAIVYERTSGRVTREAVYAGFVDLTNRGILKGDSTFGYDAAGRMIKGFNPLFAGGTVFTEYGHDPKGNATEITDENGKQDNLLYDALDRLTQITQVRGGTTYSTGYTHDSLGHTKEVTDPDGKTTEYLFDDLGRLVKLTAPNTGVTVYVYDDAGNLGTKVEDLGGTGRTTTYAHDGLNRLTLVDFPTDADWTISYDTSVTLNQKGRLASVTNGVVTTDLEYSPRGELALERTTIGGTSYEVSYAYDAGGKVIEIEAPSGTTIATAFAGPRPKTVTVSSGGDSQEIRDLEFLPFGPRTHADLPPEDEITGYNTVLSARQYDLRHQVTEIDVTSPAGTVLDLSYSYNYTTGPPGPNDTSALLDRAIDHLDSSQSRFYFYDDFERLWKATDLAGSSLYAYTYDANGNRTQQTAPSGTTNFDYATGTDQLAQATGAEAMHYAHDPYGNRIWAGPTAYAGIQSQEYDESNRLVTVRDPVTFAVLGAYTYDAFGRRVRKVASGVTTLFFYDAAQNLVEERRQGTLPTQVRNSVYVEDELMGVIDHGASTVFTWVHSDHQATPRAATSALASQNVEIVWRASHSPFGAVTEEQNPDGDLQMFSVDRRAPGQHHDRESGLYYNGFRDYDPRVGSYVESDPIGRLGGLNTYVYAAANPIMLVDPLGLQACGGGGCPSITDQVVTACCAAMRSQYPGVGGIIACCRGQLTACAFGPPQSWDPHLDPLAKALLTECTRAHEEHHSLDFVCPADENCEKYQPAVPLSDDDWHRSECAASRVAMDCWVRILDNCRGRALCIGGIKRWARSATQAANFERKCGLQLPSVLQPQVGVN